MTSQPPLKKYFLIFWALSASHLYPSFLGKAAIAQITPDTTLQGESSNVDITTDGLISTYRVNGGATRTSSLFHSFEQFSIPSGDIVYFDNADSIGNIFSRVTGSDISSLDGTIQANGNANIFLLNPAGIVIGPEARLDIGGSFLASTGSGLRFSNEFIYDVESTTQPPLLSITSPLGITFGDTPGNIQVLGLGRFGEGSSPSEGLSVPLGRTLALLGGEVSLSKVKLEAPGGRIEIGGIAELSEIDIIPLQQGFDINFDQVSRFGDIEIAGQSIVNASGPGGGAIELQGKTIAIREGSALISDTLGALDGQRILVAAENLSLEDSSFLGAATFGNGTGSQIEVKATKNIVINGAGTFRFKLQQIAILTGKRKVEDRNVGGFSTTTRGIGKTGDITVNANNISMNQGAIISTSSLGTGDSGNIELVTSEELRISGSGIETNSLSSGVALVTPLPELAATGLTTAGLPAGKAGNIRIGTSRLVVEDGAAIASATVSDQNSGNILIEATDSIVLQGIFVPLPIPTSITTATIGGRGNAGSLQINTGSLRLEDASEIYSDSGAVAFQGLIPFGGASGDLTINARELIEIIGGSTEGTFFPANLSSKTYSDQPAGSIEVDVPILVARNGGRIISSTFGKGDGGFIKINSEAIVLSGAGTGAGSADVKIVSGVFANSGLEIRRPSGELLNVGAGGTIELNSSTLTIQDEAEISVGSSGSGIGGNIAITADSINLEQQGRVTATSGSGEGGNINLTANVLTLDQGLLSSSTQQGDGGNLNFNLQESLLLRNNSLISTEAGTNSAGGNGGDIDINITDGFVIASPTENSDIRANAFEGNGGKVTIGSLGLLGIAYRPKVLDTPESDITSSSRFGDSGIVTINAPDVDPDSVEIELSDDIKVPRLEQGCLTSLSDQSRFVQTGRGGLPTNPSSPVAVDGLWQDLEPLPSESLRSQQIAMSPTSNAPLGQPVIKSLKEASNWTLANNGEIQLIAPEEASSLNLSTASTCSGG